MFVLKMNNFSELSKTNINHLDKKFIQKISQFEDSVRNVEKKTVWRIQDCEDLLKKRVTEDFINSNFSALEDKLMQQVLF